MVKVFTTAHLPDALQQAWLQHLRDFDTAHPDCHFEVGVDAPDMSLGQMVEMLQVTPGLTFQKILARDAEVGFGDIIQIGPEHHWALCLAVVSEPKPFGCMAYVRIPKGGREPPADAYIRLERADYEVVGKASWITAEP